MVAAWRSVGVDPSGCRPDWSSNCTSKHKDARVGTRQVCLVEDNCEQAKEVRLWCDCTPDAIDQRDFDCLTDSILAHVSCMNPLQHWSRRYCRASGSECPGETYHPRTKLLSQHCVHPSRPRHDHADTALDRTRGHSTVQHNRIRDLLIFKR